MPGYPQMSPQPAGASPDLDILRQLLSQNQEKTGRNFQVSPQTFARPEFNTAGTLESIPTSDLVAAMRTAGGGRNPEVFRALRGAVESRSNDAARGRAPANVANTSALQTTPPHGLYNPWNFISNLLGGVNSGLR